MVRKSTMLLFILLFSCMPVKKIPGIYRVYKSNVKTIYTVEINENKSYSLETQMVGRSAGNWALAKEYIILNSFYRSCCIDSLVVDYSESESSDSTTFVFSLLREEIKPNISYIEYGNNYFVGTLFAQGNVIKVPKSLNVSTLNVLSSGGFGKPLARSSNIDVLPVDTIKIYYDYPYNSARYIFMENEKFRINIRKKALLQ